MIPISAAPKRFAASLGRGRRSAIACASTGLFSPKLLKPAAAASATVCLDRFSTYSHPSTGTYAFSQSILDSKVQCTEKKIDLVPLNLVGPRAIEWYTGAVPIYGLCAGVQSDGTIYSLPQVSWEAQKMTRAHLQNYFDNTWTMTEVLFAGLQGEDAFVRPPYHGLRHPMIFYYGHTAVLYINKLRVAGLLKQPLNSYFEVLFETGVDEMSWDDLSKNEMKWPSVSEVHAYRKQVYHTVTELISSLTDQQLSSMSQNSPLWALVMSFEHERIHFETSSVLMAELPLQCVRFPEGLPKYHQSAYATTDDIERNPVVGVHYPENKLIPVERQTVQLGKPSDKPSFGWDNEYGHRLFEAPAFMASTFKVTNGEYLEFVKDGGYGREELWTAEGWKWRSYRNSKWPYFWIREGPQGLNQFRLRLIFDEVPMQWDWPVCVNYHEAAAFAKWKGLRDGKSLRLMTEIEHHAIRNKSERPGEASVRDHVVVHGGGDLMRQAGINANLSVTSMSPVDALPPNERGFHDVFGNAWEWAEDYFSALPGFQVHPYYEDFSSPCFDGQHHIILGGSFISTGNEASIYSRFHFRPHFLQHSSFRLVEQLSSGHPLTSDTNAPGPFVGDYPFRRSAHNACYSLSAQPSSLPPPHLEDNKSSREQFALNLQLSQQYGAVSQLFALSEEMSGRTASMQLEQLVLRAAKSININVNEARVLEVGCGPGGLSFRLALHAQSVLGIDSRHLNVATAKQLLNREAVSYSLPHDNSENSRTTFAVTTPLLNSHAQLDFRCADPMCLPAELLGFDIVVLNDVIDKVSSPGSLLGRLGGPRGLVRPGGLVTVISAFNWSEQTTPRSLWITGDEGDSSGANVASKATPEDALVRKLSAEFAHVCTEQAPLFWQESSREVRGKLISAIHLRREFESANAH